jgi:hypothetical protein
MPRKNKMSNRPELLGTQLSELISLVKDLSPEARIEIPHAHYEDAHVSIYPPPTMGAEKVQRLEQALGERCNEILVETGLFIIGAVQD